MKVVAVREKRFIVAPLQEIEKKIAIFFSPQKKDIFEFLIILFPKVGYPDVFSHAESIAGRIEALT